MPASDSNARAARKRLVGATVIVRMLHTVSTAALALACVSASAAGLYRCVVVSGEPPRYSTQPCAADTGVPVPIDRTTPTDATLPGGGRGPARETGATPDRPRGPALEHRLSASERERLERLRQEPATTTEAVAAREIESAAVREGVAGELSASERRTLESLRQPLEAEDPATRAEALRAWQEVYARHRPRARPRLPGPPPALGNGGVRSPPEPPLGAVVPGTRGPLTVAPAEAPPLPSARPAGPIADPKTGQVLAPAGERLVDPLTGTLWMRAGPNYVDPTTGRVIPGR